MPAAAIAVQSHVLYLTAHCRALGGCRSVPNKVRWVLYNVTMVLPESEMSYVSGLPGAVGQGVAT